jgi:ankyrin repeat protein
MAIVKLLLETGATVDAKENDGSTPLWQAAYRGDEAIVKLLLEKGAAVDGAIANLLQAAVVMSGMTGSLKVWRRAERKTESRGELGYSYFRPRLEAA